MELDTRTLVVASVLCAALMGAVSVAFAALRGPTRIVGRWGAAMLVLALGLSGLALRDIAPSGLSIVAANTLILAGWVFALRGLRLFLGRSTQDLVGWGLVALAALLLFVFSELRPNTFARLLTVTTAILVMASRAALLLHRHAPPDCRLSCRVAESVFWAVAAISLARAAVALMRPPQSILTPEPFNAGVFLFYMAFIIVTTLAVLAIEIESLQAALLRAARNDPLTGMLNRRAFLAEFEREEARAARGGTVFSLAIFDLDHFKRINDRHGHPVGDRVLKAFAGVLRAAIRRQDTAGRYGGEEFALLMPETGKDTAHGVAERVRRALEERGLDVDGRRIDLTVSAGVAVFGADGTDWDSLLSAADGALYEAKRKGSNRVVRARPRDAGQDPVGLQSAA
jgi:diguanylate cyclase (GGDEF)-like protein